jgi:hypothetical protein
VTGVTRGDETGFEPTIADPFVQRVAQLLLERLDEVSGQLFDRIVTKDAFYAGVAVSMEDDIRAAIDDNLGQLLRGLTGLEPLDLEYPRELAQRRAGQGVPVAALLHAYRLAAELVWEHHLAAGHAWGHGEFDIGDVLDGAAKIWSLTNTYCGVISEAYDETVADRARQSERERTLLLDALLEGRTQDLPRISEAARVLDLPQQGHLVVVVADNPAAGDEGLASIEQALRVQGIRSAWRLRSDHQVGLVVLEPQPGRRRPENLEAALRRGPGRVGVSPTYTDLVDTFQHVHLADLARTCLPPGRPAVAHFDDHPLGTLVASVPDQAERLARLVLGPVLSLEPDERDTLLGTLQTWIASGGSTTETAARLYCHRNTVHNRLQRLETLTHRSLKDPTALTEICLATRAAILLPDVQGT